MTEKVTDWLEDYINVRIADGQPHVTATWLIILTGYDWIVESSSKSESLQTLRSDDSLASLRWENGRNNVPIEATLMTPMLNLSCAIFLFCITRNKKIA